MNRLGVGTATSSLVKLESIKENSTHRKYSLVKETEESKRISVESHDQLITIMQ